MLGLRRLNKWVLEEKPHPKGDEIYGGMKQPEPPVPAPQPEYVVGEPVLTLAKSILETEDWEYGFDERSSISRSSIVSSIRHKTNGKLFVLFSKTLTYDIKWEYECLADWMTWAERRYMLGVRDEFEEVIAARSEAKRVERNKATRDIFMRELVDHHGQLELQLN